MASVQAEEALGVSTSRPFGSLRIHSFHPGGTLTESIRAIGHHENSAPWDDPCLPGQFTVWLASPEAEFLKGSSRGRIGTWMS